MPSSFLLDSSTLAIQCPHCGHTEFDDYELMLPDCIEQMRCSRCGGVFHFAVLECRRCASESVFHWLHRPADEAVAHLTCHACGHSHAQDEATEPGARAHA